MKVLSKVFILVVGLAFVGSFWHEDKSSGSGTATVVPDGMVKVEQKKQPLKMTLTQLERDVKENELAIQRRVEDAGGVLVTAKVKSVETVMWSVQVELYGSNEFLSPRAVLHSSEKDKAAVLRRGQSVTLRCERPVRVMGLGLNGCTLVN